MTDFELTALEDLLRTLSCAGHIVGGISDRKRADVKKATVNEVRAV
jgi:hypothetical protein